MAFVFNQEVGYGVIAYTPRGYDMDFAEMERWYDGYKLNGVHVYNPKSVTDAIRKIMITYENVLKYEVEGDAVFLIGSGFFIGKTERTPFLGISNL
jgi:hypothetical protein